MPDSFCQYGDTKYLAIGQFGPGLRRFADRHRHAPAKLSSETTTSIFNLGQEVDDILGAAINARYGPFWTPENLSPRWTVNVLEPSLLQRFLDLVGVEPLDDSPRFL